VVRRREIAYKQRCDLMEYVDYFSRCFALDVLRWGRGSCGHLEGSGGVAISLEVWRTWCCFFEVASRVHVMDA
jgi:hypothetical protein